MAESSFPYSTNPMPQANWEKLAGPWQDDGVLIDADVNSLKLVAGSGMQPVVSIGDAFVRGERYVNSAAVTLAAIPTEASLTRYDRIVLKYDRTVPSVVITRVAGTAGSGPPALVDTATVTYVPLAKIRIDPGDTSIVTADITDERWFCGRRVRSYTTSNPPTAIAGAIGHVRDTGAVVLATGAGEIPILGPGGRKLLVPGGYQKYTSGGVILNTGLTVNSYQDIGAVGTIVVPGVSGVLYELRAQVYVTGGDCRIAIKTTSGAVVAISGATGTATFAQISFPYEGTGSPITIKLAGQKHSGSANATATGTASYPAYLMALDLGLQ